MQSIVKHQNTQFPFFSKGHSENLLFTYIFEKINNKKLKTQILPEAFETPLVQSSSLQL